MIIEFLINEKTTRSEIKVLYEIVNKAYERGEKGMWGEGYKRISLKHLENVINLKQIVIIKIESQIVGCIQLVIDSTKNTASFGMLSVKEKFEGKGIGKALISFVEENCKKLNIETIQLELLTPIKNPHPSKEMLKKWYFKLGFRPIRSVPFNHLFPHLRKNLVLECEFQIWHKKLK